MYLDTWSWKAKLYQVIQTTSIARPGSHQVPTAKVVSIAQRPNSLIQRCLVAEAASKNAQLKLRFHQIFDARRDSSHLEHQRVAVRVKDLVANTLQKSVIARPDEG